MFEDSTSSDKILIIDKVHNPSQYKSSRYIIQEINKFFPEVKVSFAYSLAKGGIAVHLTSKQDRDLLLHHLPTESFGGGLRHLPRGNGSKVAYIKGVDTSVDLDHLTRYLQIRGISIFEVRRLLRRHSGRPTQV